MDTKNMAYRYAFTFPLWRSAFANVSSIVVIFEYTTRPCITREAQVGQALHTQYVQRGVGKQENRTKKK